MDLLDNRGLQLCHSCAHFSLNSDVSSVIFANSSLSNGNLVRKSLIYLCKSFEKQNFEMRNANCCKREENVNNTLQFPDLIEK